MGKGYKPPPLSEHQMMERRVAQLLKHIQVCNIRSTRTVLANDSELILGDSTTVARMEALQFDRKHALDLAAIVVPLFVIAMGSLMATLLLLLRETQLATGQINRRF